MDLNRTVHLAKSGKLSRSDVYSALLKCAEERRAPGQSVAQSFATFVAGEGAELMQVHSALGAAGSGDIVLDHAAASPLAPITKSAPSGEWHDLVDFCKRAHKRSHPHDTDNQANAAAVNAAMSTSEGMFLFKQQKRAERFASGHFTTDDLKVLDGVDAEVQSHGEMRKRANQHMSEYEHLVAETMQKYPHMTESAAGDHVRSMPSGMEAWTRHNGVPGKNGTKPSMVPQGESMHTGGRDHPSVPETSRRTPPARSPLWESDHSGSGPPTTPSRVPPPADQTPSVKAWNNLKRKALFDWGFTEERTVEILKCLPQGKAAIAAVVAEARAAVVGS